MMNNKLHSVKLSPRQRGDFQTPEALAQLVWKTLDPSQFDFIIEPTFGKGSFLSTLPDTASEAILGWEIDQDHFEQTKVALHSHPKSGQMRLSLGDIFKIDQNDVSVDATSRVLVIGNPPWVTNSEQSSLGSLNTGTKRNLKSLSGLEAKTGKANFDISEAIILHLIEVLKNAKLVQFALLGKFIVLRNLLQFLRAKTQVGDFEFHRIDALKHFGAAVDAGLIKFKVGRSVRSESVCQIFASVGGRLEREVGLLNGRFVYDVTSYNRNAFLENTSLPAYIWRQGIKHDLGDILELTQENGFLVNRLGEKVEVEPQTLFYLHKSSDIFHGRPARFLIPIYQRDLKDTLDDLPQRYPLLHSYLMKHQEAFVSRKSSIYRNKSPFTLFGIGEYTHSSFKIAVGGLYSNPVFRLLQTGEYPVAVDDTSYAISTNDHEEANYIFAVLNLEKTTEFLKSISYPKDKRTFSKEVLSRVCIPSFTEVPEELRKNLNNAGRLTEWLAQYQKQALLF